MPTIEVNGKEYSGGRLWQNEKLLRVLFLKKDLTTTEIGERLGCDQTTAAKWVRRHELRQEQPWEDEQLLTELYVEQRMSVPEIADKLGCSNHPIYSNLEEYGISRRSISEARVAHFQNDSNVPLRTTRDGYEVLQHRYDGVQYRVRLHRLVAVAEHGFDAVAGKSVHHGRDGSRLPAAHIPWANWPENLKPVNRDRHRQEHQQMRLESPEAPHQSEAVLREMFWGQNLSQREMAEKLGVSRQTIKRWMKTHELRPSDRD